MCAPLNLKNWENFRLIQTPNIGKILSHKFTIVKLLCEKSETKAVNFQNPTLIKRPHISYINQNLGKLLTYPLSPKICLHSVKRVRSYPWRILKTSLLKVSLLSHEPPSEFVISIKKTGAKSIRVHYSVTRLIVPRFTVFSDLPDSSPPTTSFTCYLMNYHGPIYLLSRYTVHLSFLQIAQ